MSRPNISKYRPVLTHEQINHLISLCKADMSPQSVRCISVLSPYEYKIQNLAVTPSHTLTRKSIEEQTGLHSKPNDYDINHLLGVWKADPSKLSTIELMRVYDYRYMNDLMTPEEEKEYENSLVTGLKTA